MALPQERHIRVLSGNYGNLLSYLDRKEVIMLPYNETMELSVSSSNVHLFVAADIIAGNVYIDGTGASSNGDYVVAVDADFTAGTAHADIATISDSIGNILNLVEIRDADSHDPILTNGGRKVYGLLQVAVSTTDHAAIDTDLGDENLQISFVYVAADGTLTLTNITAVIEISLPKLYALRNMPSILKQGATIESEVIQDLASSHISTYRITTGTTAGSSTLTLADGTMTNSGVSERDGDATAITMPDAAAFNANSCDIYLNGTRLSKQAEVTTGHDVSYTSAGVITIVPRVDAVDVITVVRKY
jgi:hypothetical protein